MSLVKALRIVVTFFLGAALGYFVALLTVLGAWMLSQTGNEYDGGNAGVIFYPLAVLAGAFVAPFAGIGSVFLVEHTLARYSKSRTPLA